MKQLVRTLFGLSLVAGLTTHPALAQTTNGVTTGAERQALSDAYTRSEAVRRASATPSSPGANTPSSSGSGRRQTLTEMEAEMNAMFGFETAAQKEAARRAVLQRDRDRYAAEQRKDEARKAAAEVERKEYVKDQDRRITSMVPWDKVGFEISDCQELGSLSTNYNPTASMVQVLEQARAARPAFVALYAQPRATYEALRALAQQLPQHEGNGYLYGINTAIQQYDQLYERFPARRATAAADLAQAIVTYFGWFRAFDQSFEPDVFRLEKMKLLEKAAAANPAAGHVAELRLALNLKDKYAVSVLSKSDGKGTDGMIKVQGGVRFINYLDTAMVGQLGRFAYAGCRHYLQNGQAATLGLTPDDVRHATGERAYELAELQLVRGQPAAARAWLCRALEADPTSENLQQGTVKYYRMMLYEYPEMFDVLQPAEWQMLQKSMGLAEPLRLKAVQAWLADTVRLPDDPRWQTLTATDRADLQQACDVAAWLTRGELLLHYKSQLNAKRATWNFVLAVGPGSNLDEAETLWHAMTDGGDVAAARNLYRAYLLGDKLPARPEPELMRVCYLLKNASNYGRGKHRYQAGLLLLDELPGYPPLGKRFKKAGREMLVDAAAEGDEGAKERVKRGF